MISKTGIRNAKKFCCEDISLIENYEQAIDETDKRNWVCHHRKGIELNKTGEELEEIGLYYNRPADELIFLTRSEHTTLHNQNRVVKSITRLKISKANKGRVRSDEFKNKLKGRNSPNSKAVCQIDIKTGFIIKRLPSISIAANTLKLNNSRISYVCNGKMKSTGGYIWKYKSEVNNKALF